jgi:hypothetical protein
MVLPFEMIEHIYKETDIDTKCSMNKVFGNRTFRVLKVQSHELGNLLRNKQNRIKCMLELRQLMQQRLFEAEQRIEEINGLLQHLHN